jgi:hypothetical protein
MSDHHLIEKTFDESLASLPIKHLNLTPKLHKSLADAQVTTIGEIVTTQADKQA